ncbi:extracellular solute-binding protein [Occultella glacieicola]|uniref:Extracellular solute-binding protein n=1 Tax=Occultella glacieicola TaxID=2518684 RepID=A0ABY2E524_9MICO|nr:extracellular solute-binding protein [Occultella glacieicola]TDE95129.1 extracellular solute-binding protein [Occultella glacieicola]
MTRRNRTATAIVAVGGLALTLGACAPQAAEPVDDGVITIFSQQGADSDLNTNEFTLFLEEEFDVDLQFETTTWDAGAASEARQIALASGDYPDAFLLIPWVDQFTQAELVKFGEQGVVRPLNDLLEDNAPNLVAAWEETPEWEQLATAPDGNVWGLPQWNDCFHCTYPSKLWMNSAWLDAVGMEQPTTPEELTAVLTAFRDSDPNGNGQADEVPLSGSPGANSVLPFLMNPFVYVPSSTTDGSIPATLALDGDTVTLQATLDGWREGLGYMNSLYEEGLVDEAAFTQNQDALLALGDIAGDPILGAATVGHPGVFVTIGQEDGRDAQYNPVAPLAGPNGSPASELLSSVPGGTLVITNNASDADAASLVQIVDWMIDYDNHLRAEWGEEGVAWDYPAEGDVALDESLEPLYLRHRLSGAEATENANVAWGPLAQYYGSTEFRGAQVVSEDIYDLSGYERRLFEATEPYAENSPTEAFPYWNLWIPEEDSAELATAQTNVESLVLQASAEFVTGVRDIDSDADWQAFQDALVSSGSDRYLEIYQAAWDASN